MAVKPAGRNLHCVSGAQLISINLQDHLLELDPIFEQNMCGVGHMQTSGLVCLHGSWNFPLKCKLTDNMMCIIIIIIIKTSKSHT